MPPNAPDFRVLTEVATATWSSGDFNEIAWSLVPVAEDLVRAANPAPGERVLDIACGSGNVALIAARRYCEVTGIDIATNLIDRARARAAANGLAIDMRVGDAQALPFEDARFDVVISAFGVIFAPDQPRAAAEALRVCRPGGRIALANWMPEGFGRDFFGIHRRHAPPPEGTPSPLEWGTEDGLRRLFGTRLASLSVERRVCPIFYRSVEHAVETYASRFGPTIRAVERVGPDGAAALKADIAAFVETSNRAGDGTVRMDADYLRVLATRA
jgi:SAM-dependent methyltransferase